MSVVIILNELFPHSPITAISMSSVYDDIVFIELVSLISTCPSKLALPLKGSYKLKYAPSDMVRLR